MARRRRKTTTRPVERGAFDTARPYLLDGFMAADARRHLRTLYPDPYPAFPDQLPEDLRDLEDRRTWTPDPHYRPARALDGPLSVRLTVPATPLRARASGRSYGPSLVLPRTVAFRAPQHVAICVRRKQRREVLFAAGVGGGRGRRAPRRRSEFSSVSCQR